ncbi:MAG: hypothetical protein QM757_25730 [Paludibaculum sp.]
MPRQGGRSGSARLLREDVDLESNQGASSSSATGKLGVHYVYLWWPEAKKYSRYVNFRLDAETGIESGDRDFDTIYPFTHERVQLGRRDYMTKRGRFVGYISADTNHFDGIWLRDWIYTLPAYKYWEREMQCGLDRFLEVQREDGQTPDGIERDGRTWRVGLESDVEYILTLGVWDTWKATGDDAWLRAAMPKLEKALNYIRSDPKHWDAKNRLIQRQHQLRHLGLRHRRGYRSRRQPLRDCELRPERLRAGMFVDQRDVPLCPAILPRQSVRRKRPARYRERAVKMLSGWY